MIRRERNKGITLIALVITIIVILILAGVAIVTLTGDNGLLTKAREAKNASENAELEEQIRSACLEGQTAKLSGIIGNVNDFIKNSLESSIGNIKDVSGDDNAVTIIINSNNEEKTYYYDVKNGNVVSLNLPESYNKVKYLESNYNTKINTGVSIETYSGISSYLIICEQTAYNFDGVFGTDTHNYGGGKQLYGSLSHQPNSYLALFRSGYSNVNLFTGKEKHTIENTQRGIFVDGVKKGEYIEAHWGETDAYIKGEMKYYKVQMYNDNMLIRNYIPCLDKFGKPCLFDTMSKQPFYNNGIGEFGYELIDGTYVAPK